MADLLFIAVTVAFFALALVLVRACDRIIGPDHDLATDFDPGPDTAATAIAASATTAERGES